MRSPIRRSVPVVAPAVAVALLAISPSVARAVAGRPQDHERFASRTRRYPLAR